MVNTIKNVKITITAIQSKTDYVFHANTPFHKGSLATAASGGKREHSAV